MPAPKLTPEQITAVRAEAAEVGRGYAARKARELGVSRNGLWQIIHGQRRAPIVPFVAENYAERIRAKIA